MDNIKLQNLDIEDFLTNYWQKKPLLIRQAFTDFETVISPEELAGLSCEEDVFSRLVIEKDGAVPWQLASGPFKEEDFLNLPETHYSLLVSECEKWIPELNELVDQFNFIPKWRMDDLMISYAPEHGSVGPHIDQYDVFLIQAHGQRHWHIQHPENIDHTLIEGVDMALLNNFQSDEDWVCNPGDLLYLPPGVAHHGISLGRCMTYSIGYRAPSSKEVLIGLTETLSDAEVINETTRYLDPILNTQRHPNEIKSEDIAQLKANILQSITNSNDILPRVMGELMTQKSVDLNIACNEEFAISDQTELVRHPDATFAYHLDQDTQQLYFFCNGKTQLLESNDLKVIQFLCDQTEFRVDQIPNHSQPSIKQLIEILISHSQLLIMDE
ncbi:MAG: cupin domain-containing protein [Gammaproteobacteria bacterium]|nr:cupin domain-containing protein [Gammaproteobacteria bacterium]